MLHAAGPGHGKAVIDGYLMAGERALQRGFTLSLLAALLQAVVALALVGGGRGGLAPHAAGLNQAGTVIETAGFACVAVLGAAVTWARPGSSRAPQPRGGAGLRPGCGHAGLADGTKVERLAGWREQAGVVLAAGTRPCAGAIWSWSSPVAGHPVGPASRATLAMALGTAITTGVLAALAVFAKAFASGSREAAVRAGRSRSACSNYGPPPS